MKTLIVALIILISLIAVFGIEYSNSLLGAIFKSVKNEKPIPATNVLSSITFVRPKGGEVWAIGKKYNIAWNYPAELVKKKIGLAVFIIKNDDSLSREIYGAKEIITGSGGNAIWDISNNFGKGEYRSRVEVKDLATGKEYSITSNLFEVVSVPANSLDK